VSATQVFATERRSIRVEPVWQMRHFSSILMSLIGFLLFQLNLVNRLMV
jgi:hypothetical protein